MQILARFCFLIAACSVLEVYKRFLLFSLGLLMMDCVSFIQFLTQSNDFGCGFLVFGYFSQAFNIFGLILMFLLGFKVLQFSLHGRGLIQLLCDIRGKSNHKTNGLCSKIGFGEECDAKILSCNCGPLKFLENSKSMNSENSVKSKSEELINGKDVSDVDDDDDGRESFEEDQLFDVMALRKMMKIERQKANMALMELEKERMAAASAADEAMAMILRLQNEKSAVEIEANQYRRLAEQKREYDREVIQSLQWIVMKHESERSLLEDKLRLCIEKLKQHVKDDDDDEMEQLEEFDLSLSMLNSNVEDDIHGDGFISSLDMESSEW